MSNQQSGDTGAKFVALSLLLFGLFISSVLLFWLARPATDLVPEVDLSEVENHHSQRHNRSWASGYASKDRPVETFKTIRKRPDFTVADTLDEADRIRQAETVKVVNQARQLVDNKRYSEAIDHLKVAVEKHPDYYMGWMELGIAHLFQDFDLESAKAAFMMAAEIEPNNQNTLDAIKNVYLELKDPEGGISFLKKLAERFPSASKIEPTIGYLANHYR